MHKDSTHRKDKKIAKDNKYSNKVRPKQQRKMVPISTANSTQTAEQLRKQLAKKALQQLQPQKQNIQKDDFFLVENEQNKKMEHQAINEQLNQQYMRKHHKLYENLTQQFQNCHFGPPIQYKGHTLCITSFQVTPTHIYSCSKDKSIIKWDRQTKQKTFISLGKDINHHRSDILSLSLHGSQNVLATAADDCQIKLWDTRSCELIDTLRGHKNTINGIKFGIDSNNLCSVSADLTLKHWDFSQRGLIGTYYQHNGEILDIDHFNSQDFISSGYDKQVIAWKTQRQTKVVYKGHNYAIDRVRTINQQRFITCCQDGSVNLWNIRKTKPVFKCSSAHPKGWISALDNIKQSNIFATGGIDRTVKIWAIDGDNQGMKVVQEIQVNGIVTDIKMDRQYLAVTECDELRLGRWITDKCRNKIKIFPRIHQNSH